jgi:predicted polyphosphate/ATP-dependent NAD kinase
MDVMRTAAAVLADRERTGYLGLVVNPIAGMGGRVGLKGTDGAAILRRAVELGATPVAARRAARALARLDGQRGELRVLAGAGAMGADLTREHGFRTESVGAAREPTQAADTRAAAAEMAWRGVDLLLFAGGDGTARDVHDAVGGAVPVLGIPTGVKMHSGVFAAGPEAAGDVAAAYLRRPGRLVTAEVVDLDEAAVRDGRLVTRLHGRVRVPAEPERMLGAKGVARGARDADLEALCDEIADGLELGRLYILGPGTTTERILRRLGLRGTLLGVDAVRDGRLAGADLREDELLRLLEPDTTVIAGVIGGQGSLFGRGNQQISAEVLRHVDPDRIVIVAAREKLLALDPPWLRVDTGDPEVDRRLLGYRRVRCSPRDSVVLKVTS